MHTQDPFWSEAVGQSGAVDILAHVTSPEGVGELAHAWLITGPPGSGRSNLAYRFAAALIARDPADREQVFRQVRAHTHPDLEVLTTEGSIIKIEDARRVASRAHLAPSVGRFRVIVAEDADRLPEYASNTILKELEEPPASTVWILCAPSEADLLPTISSRTRSLRLVTPSTQEVAQLLHERDGVGVVDAERAARLAQNHIGMAKTLATDPAALTRRTETVRTVLDAVTLGEAMAAAATLTKLAEEDAKALTVERDEQERAELLRNLGIAPGGTVPPKLRSQVRALEEDQKRRAKRSLADGIDRVFTDLTSVFRDATLLALGTGGQLVNEEFRDELTRLAEQLGAAGSLARVDRIGVAREQLLRNVTPQLVVEALLAAFVADSDTTLKGHTV